MRWGYKLGSAFLRQEVLRCLKPHSGSTPPLGFYSGWKCSESAVCPWEKAFHKRLLNVMVFILEAELCEWDPQPASLCEAFCNDLGWLGYLKNLDLWNIDSEEAPLASTFQFLSKPRSMAEGASCESERLSSMWPVVRKTCEFFRNCAERWPWGAGG